DGVDVRVSSSLTPLRKLWIGRKSYKINSIEQQQMQLVVEFGSLTPPGRPVPSRRIGSRPVTVSCNIQCRDDSLQASSIVHVTRRRHPRVPSGRV
ncbi:hypothetical protein EVAR_71808_1, partial [Eumeta japonica]